jgi:hypothetical protein
MPIYFLLSLKLPPGLNTQLERIIRECLWRDKDGPKQSLSSWEIVCKLRDKGGLGIVNFSKKNDSLLLKHLDKFYNKAEVPWVQLIWFSYYTSSVPHAERLCGSFWWRDIVKLVEGFRDVTQIKPGSGDTFLFWSDNWHILDSYEPLSSRFPRLFSYLPLSAQAYSEYCMLDTALRDSPLSDDKDVWFYQWGQKYQSRQFYKHLHSNLNAPPVYSWIWKSACIMRTKTFAWLLLSDRLNTCDLLVRRHWKVIEDKHCVLCVTRDYEDRTHLFFDCLFSRRVWAYLQINWSMGDNVQSILAAAKRDFAQPFFMEILIMACWNIWKIRNGKIFENQRPTFTKWKNAFIHDMTIL